MTTVFIEARPKGRREGTAIVDYVVEEQGDRFLKAFKTQGEAITWAKSEGHSPHVARVRHLNDKKIPDHWRPVQYSAVMKMPSDRCARRLEAIHVFV
jgi:hypothetical protein